MNPITRFRQGWKELNTLKAHWMCPACFRSYNENAEVSAIFRTGACLDCGFNSVQEEKELEEENRAEHEDCFAALK